MSIIDYADHPILNAIDVGGGQECDVRGVLRALYAAGYTIVKRTDAEIAAQLEMINVMRMIRCETPSK